MPKGIYIHKRPSMETRAKMSVTHLRLRSGDRLPKPPKGRKPEWCFTKKANKKRTATLKLKFLDPTKAFHYIDGRFFDKDYQKKYRRSHPELTSLLNRRGWARRHGAVGSHTVTEWTALKMKYLYACLSCGKTEPEIKLTEDHVVPLIKGGTNYIENIQPLCVSCNSRKNCKTIDYRITYAR